MNRIRNFHHTLPYLLLLLLGIVVVIVLTTTTTTIHATEPSTTTTTTTTTTQVVDPVVDISAESTSTLSSSTLSSEDQSALNRFYAYLAINTSHPTPRYTEAVQYLVKTAQQLGFPHQIVKLEPGGLEAVIITYKNLLDEYKDNTESIMMNSHMDIVPADPAKWNSDPFKPMVTPDGKIFARGSQDMKSVGMQYLEAVYRLKQRDVKLRYIIRIVFVPEEEVGAEKGMQPFLKTEEFKNLNVIFSFDEGIPVLNPQSLNIYYGENVAWWFKVTCEGNVGHGSQFIKNTASSQMNKYMRRVFDFRDHQEQLITLSDDVRDESDVVTINMNAMQGGIPTSVNVVPREIHGYFDSRIPPNYNLTEMVKLYTEVWTEGTNCTVHWIQHEMNNPISDLNFPIIQKTIAYFKSKYSDVRLKYFPAATDARFVRRAGIPCLGVSLLSGVPMLLHDHNEHITQDIFLRGIQQYQDLLIHLSRSE